MQLVQDTMHKLRRVVRSCRDAGVHETAVVMSLSEEHDWLEVLAAMPLQLVRCDRYTEQQRVLLTLPDAAVPYLRVPAATDSLCSPMLFPSDSGRLRYHTEKQCKAVNRAEISRRCGQHFRRMLEESGVEALDMPYFSGFNRIIMRQAFLGTMLCAPGVHSFLVHTTPQEYGQIMRRFSAFKKHCKAMAGKPLTVSVGRKLVTVECAANERETVLADATRELGFLTT